MGLRSSTTHKAFQHLKARPVITKLVLRLEMVGGNFWNFWRSFSRFCEKLQNVCSVAANPDQLEKNGCDFWTQRPTNPQIRYKLQVLKILYTGVLLLCEMLKPLLGCTRYRRRCYAAIRLSQRIEPSGHAVHEEVDGLVIRGQHGRRFVLLRHTHRPQRRPYLICTSRSGNFRHRCVGG